MNGKLLSNFIAVDIGSSKILTVVAHINKQAKPIVSAQVLQQSKGFKAGVITNMHLAENSIFSAIYALEQEHKKNIKRVIVSLNGHAVKSYYVHQSINIGNQPISKQDIKKLINKALTDYKVAGQEIIHYFPIEFIVDQQLVESPEGLYAKELSCHLHIIAADSNMIMNLIKCFAKYHIEVSEIIASIYATGLAVLSNDEIQLGAIVIDMGAHTTSYGIFLDGQLVYTNQLPLGGANITQDIARTFSVSLQEAEKLKILYGNTNPNLLVKDSIIKLEGLDQIITTTELTAIINPIILNILYGIKKQYEAINIDSMLAQQIIITGGGAMLTGIQSLVAELFQKQVRIAKPEPVAGFSEGYNSYACSTILGMLKLKSQLFQRNSSTIEQYTNANWLRRVFLWLKENI